MTNADLDAWARGPTVRGHVHSRPVYEPYGLSVVREMGQGSSAPDGWAAKLLSATGMKNSDSPNQDSFSYTLLDSGWILCIACDGHGEQGEVVSERVARTLPLFVARHLPERGPEEALRQAFAEAQQDLELCFRSAQIYSGATAVVCCVHHERQEVWTAHAGDSRVVLGDLDDGSVVCITEEHKAHDPEEFKRLKAAGAQVIQKKYDDGELAGQEILRGLGVGNAVRAAGQECPACYFDCPACTCSLNCPTCPTVHCGASYSIGPVAGPLLVGLGALLALAPGFLRRQCGQRAPPGLPAAAKPGPAPAAAPASPAGPLTVRDEEAELQAAAQEQGDFYLIRFGVAGPPLWHERAGGVVTGYTPNDDHYEEDLAPGGDAVAWCLLPGGAQGGVPPVAVGGAAARAYRFRAVPLAAALGAARDAAAARFGDAAPGVPLAPNTGLGVLGVPGAVPLALPAAPAAAPVGGAGVGGGLAALATVLGPGGGAVAPGAGAGGGLVGLPAAGPTALVAPVPGALVGPLAGGAVAAPAPALAPAPAAAAAAVPAAPLAALGGADLRVHPIMIDSMARRNRPFSDSLALLTETPWADWPVRGPRTLKWVCHFLAANGGSPVARHHRWKTDCRLSSEGGVDEHLRICTALENAVCFDQLNVTEMVSFELLGRALQIIEEKYRERLAGAADPARVDTNLYLGTEPARGNCCACPALQTRVSQELAQEHAILKERRKAREERAAAQTAKATAKPKRGNEGDARPRRDDLGGRLRDVFPLPPLQRRGGAVEARARTLDWANDCIDSLNSAYGFAKAEQPSAPATAAQRAALSHVESVNCFFFRDPFSTRFPTSAARSSVEPGADGMIVSGGDIDNCFYRIELPDDLQEYFPLPDVAAGYLGIASIDGHPVLASDPITPVRKPLMVLDGEPGRVLPDDDSCAVAGYVDKFFVFSRSPGVAQAGRDAIAKRLTEWGLVVHELSDASRDAEFLGVEIARGHRLSIKRRCIWRLRRALYVVLRRRSLSGKLMEILIGHLTWAGLIRRECLSFLCEVDAFQHAAGSDTIRLQPGVVQVLASDASDFGLGVSSRLLDPRLVASIGRCSERRRFKDPGCIQQWARAFNEVPQSLFEAQSWSAVLAMHVSTRADILCLEGDALLLAAKHFSRNVSNFGARSPALVDNLPLALAMAKGLSVLERLAIRPSTEALHASLLLQLVAFCNDRSLTWDSAATLDTVLVLFLNHLFLLGHGPGRPLHDRAAAAGAPADAAAAAAGSGGGHRGPADLIHQGLPRAGLLVLLALVGYLRPHELTRLRARHVAPPVPSAGQACAAWGLLLGDSLTLQPGRTGVWDESVLLDLDPWILRPLAALKSTLQPDALLCDLSPGAAALLGLGPLRPSLHQLRHGGASEDLALQRRPLAAVQRRGRWQSETSLRRYSKESKLLATLGLVHPDAVSFGQSVFVNLEAVLLRGLLDPRSQVVLGPDVHRLLTAGVPVPAQGARGSRSGDVIVESDSRITKYRDDCLQALQVGAKADTDRQAECKESRRRIPRTGIPGLAMSRSLGDGCLKKYGVCAEPDVRGISDMWRRCAAPVLLLASDGLWDTITAEEAIKALAARCHSGVDALLGAEALLRRSQRLWIEEEGDYCDDVTVLLLAPSASLAATGRAALPT
ncbi:unnamed protein product [Prorocentrum cordatum]|uniref:PPM-type phosphatase domain-containing protein n=1 Tax=Prorocentrum cordatum TaxID=2364126 RepID=A0ABN9V4J0_9DINO|nr:unnamed protein product [Polarella glacialis]